MLESAISPAVRRQRFRQSLADGSLLRFPGAFNALCAPLIEELGFEGVYLSGAVISASLALPDIGLTTQSEVVARCSETVRMTELPVLVDADTGFGEPANVARTVQLLEDAGAAGCHIEDQVNPKRCGHLDRKEVVGVKEMERRIAAAVKGRRDPNFVICARTDVRSIDGIEAALERAEAYVDAGADMIFPEALEDESEFEAARRAIGVPILANMTEFGKTKLLTARELSEIGVNVVIYPVTLLRLAMGAAERALSVIDAEGTQESLVGEMQTRARLYELIDYPGYNEFDDSVYNFTVNDKGKR
jgi:methylisocitrate lyase